MRIRLTGTSSTLPVSVRGTSAIANTSSGTWRGEQSSRMRVRDPPARARRRARPPSRSTTNSGIHVASPSRGHVDHQRVDDLGERQHRPVDLAGAHADAAAVDRRVRAPVDDALPRSVISIQSPWRQTPGYMEVALAVALAVGVVPEVQRHRRHRLGDDQLADLADQRLPVLVEGLDRAAQRAALQLAQRAPAAAGSRPRTRCTRRCRRWWRTARCRARRARRPSSKPSGDSGEPVEPTLRSALEVAAAARLDARLHARARCRRRWCRSRSMPALLGQVPQRAQVGMAGAAVVEHDRAPP